MYAIIGLERPYEEFVGVFFFVAFLSCFCFGKIYILFLYKVHGVVIAQGWPVLISIELDMDT